MSKKSIAPAGAMDAPHAALRDLVRAFESAQIDLNRARRRVQRLLRRHGASPPEGMASFTPAHLNRVAGERSGELALQIVLADLIREVRHAKDRVHRLDRALDEVWARSAAARVPPPAPSRRRRRRRAGVTRAPAAR